MNICVFGASSREIDKRYINEVEKMGRFFAECGNNLVFGAGGQGLMGAAARGFKDGGAKITGIIPEFFKEAAVEAIYEKCDTIIYTDSMRERKAKMEQLADAFVIVPGGIGTFEEMFEVLTLKQLGRHNKPIAVYNIHGYYDAMSAMMDASIKRRFVKESCKSLYGIFTDLYEVKKYIESDNTTPRTVKEFKD